MINLREFKNENEPKARFNYEEVLKFKLKILKKIYDKNRSDIVKNEKLLSFLEKNSYLKSYCVFKLIKKVYKYETWMKWSEKTKPDDLDQEILSRLNMTVDDWFSHVFLGSFLFVLRVDIPLYRYCRYYLVCG